MVSKRHLINVKSSYLNQVYARIYKKKIKNPGGGMVFLQTPAINLYQSSDSSINLNQFGEQSINPYQSNDKTIWYPLRFKQSITNIWINKFTVRQSRRYNFPHHPNNNYNNKHSIQPELYLPAVSLLLL